MRADSTERLIHVDTDALVVHVSEPFQASHITRRSTLLEASEGKGEVARILCPVTTAEQLFWAGHGKIGQG